jgi:hypothetical protein
VIGDDELAAIAAALATLTRSVTLKRERESASLEGRERTSRWKFAARNPELDAFGIDYRSV